MTANPKKRPAASPTQGNVRERPAGAARTPAAAAPARRKGADASRSACVASYLAQKHPNQYCATKAFRPLLSTEGGIFEARVNVRSLVTCLANARWIRSPSHPEFQCCCFVRTCPCLHFAFNFINIEIRGRVETRIGLSPQKFHPLSG